MNNNAHYPFTYQVIDQKDGRHLRDATPGEAEEFRALNPDRVFECSTVVSTGALVDTWYGPGVYVPEGF